MSNFDVQQWIDSPAFNHGAILKLMSESCASPRMPAEFATTPRLVVPCR